MHAHAELEPVVGLVLDLEGKHLGQEVQRHLAQLHGVVLPVGDRDPRGDHVCVSDGLDLEVSIIMISWLYVYLSDPRGNHVRVSNGLNLDSKWEV